MGEKTTQQIHQELTNHLLTDSLCHKDIDVSPITSIQSTLMMSNIWLAGQNCLLG